MHRLQVQLGFVLLLLSLLTGLAVPAFAAPRLGLSAHLAGITGALVLMAIGALAGSFALSARSAAILRWSWVYAAYANWLACLIGAITGASRFTPIAGAGHRGTELAEAVVSFLLVSLSLAAIAGTVLAIRGLRRTDRVAAPLAAPVTAPPA